jgi:tetratricopeptide (TPR) repeat protein
MRKGMKSIFTLYLLAGSLYCGFGQVEDPVLRMKLLLLDDRFEDVVRLADTLQVADSLKGQVHYIRGRAYQSMLNYDSAYHYFFKACQEDSTNLAFRIFLGSAMYRTGRIREAIEMYKGMVSTFQAGDRILAELADLYTMRKEYEKSLAIYKGLLEKDSLNYYYAKQAGRNYWEMNRPDSAIHYYERAFALNPRDVLIAHRLGNLYLLKGDPRTAIRRVSTGLAYDSANLDLLKLRGYLYLHDGQFTAAISDLEKAWLPDSLSVFTNKYLGMSYHEEKRFGEARSMLLRAFILDSTDAETAFFLGDACRWSGHEE